MASDDLAPILELDLTIQTTGDRGVMGDYDQGGPRLGAGFAKQVDHRPGVVDVERSGRLVTKDLDIAVTSVGFAEEIAA